PYALDQAAWDEYIAHRNARKRGAAGIPQFVKVEGASTDATLKIQKFLQPLVGKPIDTPALDTYLTRLTGVGRFESASYGLTENDGQVGLLITVREKNYAPPLLQPAFVIDGSEPQNVTFTLGGRLTMLDVAGYGSELRTDFQFGNTYGISTEFYKRFTQTTRWFFAPRVSANNTSQWLYSHNDPQADYRIWRVQFATDLGYAVSRFSEVRVGYEVGYLNANLKLGTPAFSSVSGQTGASRFHYVTDHRDDPVIPRQGYYGDLTFHWVDTSPGAATSFPNLEARTEFFKAVSRPSSVFLEAQGGSTIGYNRTGIPQYFLGGTTGLFAYGQNEVRGDQYYLFRVGYLHRLLTLPPFLGSGIYATTFY